MTHIYVLLDPIDEKTCYVGKTKTSPFNRFFQHVYGKPTSVKSSVWIENLKSKNRLPLLYIVEHASDANGLIREDFWISYFKEQGFNLLNMIAAKTPIEQKLIFHVRINESLKRKGLTGAKIEKAAMSLNLSVNDFIGECLLAYLEPKDDYKSLLSKILRIDVFDDVKRLESEVIKKLALKNGIEL